MEPGLMIYLTLVGFLGLGIFWFHVVEPLWDTLRESLQRLRDQIMSRQAEDAVSVVDASASDGVRTPQTRRPSASETADDATDDAQRDIIEDVEERGENDDEALRLVLASLRAHGYTRDDARALLRLLGRSFDNSLWTAAKSETSSSIQSLSPIARRPIDPSRFRPLVRIDDDAQ